MSGFNYNASSFLSSANSSGFWSRARLVSDGAHRQYRINSDPHVPNQPTARMVAEFAAVRFEQGVGHETQGRAAA
jgi:hypothetical protein